MGNSQELGVRSQDQLMEFEQLLKTDLDFTSEVDFQKEVQRSLQKNEREEVKQLFEELNTPKKQTKSKIFKLRPWLAAASIALLIGIGAWFLFFNSPNLNSDQLYASNFTAYDNVVHPIERGNQLEDLKTKAFTAYESKAYSEALELFKELRTNQNDSYIDFYSAMVLMQLNKQEEAIPLLQAYLAKEGPLKDRAIWYLALAFLKTDATDASKVQLKKLIALGSFKTEGAKALLAQLD